MAILKILTQEDPALSKVCHAVTKFDERLWACWKICAIL